MSPPAWSDGGSGGTCTLMCHSRDHWSLLLFKNPIYFAFLLGFWNSRIVDHIICDGLMPPSCSWLTTQMVDRLPFPREAKKAKLGMNIDHMPLQPSEFRSWPTDHVVGWIACAALQAERRRYTIAREMQKWYEGNERRDQSDAQRRTHCWKEWQPDASLWIDDSSSSSRCRADGEEYGIFCNTIDAAVAALYGLTDDEHAILLHRRETQDTCATDCTL